MKVLVLDDEFYIGIIGSVGECTTLGYGGITLIEPGSRSDAIGNINREYDITIYTMGEMENAYPLLRYTSTAEIVGYLNAELDSRFDITMPKPNCPHH